MESPFVGVAGNIGVGKTTFTEKISKLFSWAPFYESVIDNPYLDDFYKNMNRWSFNLQIYFLHHRFRSHQEMSNLKSGVIQDRTIYEDVEIFSKNLYNIGCMDKRDWNTYSELFNNMTSFISKPDLIIYLKADLDVLLKRIDQKDREYEAKIDPVYLKQLNNLYDSWIKGIDWTEVMIIDTNNFNIYKDTKQLNQIYSDIRLKI